MYNDVMFHLVLYILERIVHHFLLYWCLKQSNLFEFDLSCSAIPCALFPLCSYSHLCYLQYATLLSLVQYCQCCTIVPVDDVKVLKK